MKPRVTIIGYGTMGRAIGKALEGKAAVTPADQGDSIASAKAADFAILSVKPQNSTEALAEIKKLKLGKKTILVSIMAGVSIKKISSLSGHDKIARVMPNLGLSVGSGIAGWITYGLSAEEKKKVKKFLDMIMENFEVQKEDDINKITAVSGSGPAYFFRFAETLSKAAEGLGFSPEEARRLVQKTFHASSLLAENAEYAELIKRVASKGGTTEAALKVLKFDKMTEKAVRAAYKQAKELNE